MGDYKSFLFAWCAKTKRPSPEVTFRESGSNQQKRFICEIVISEFNYVAVGNSTNKKDAQLNAARDYVQFLVRSNFVPSSELKENLRNEGSEILGSSSNAQPLGLNKPGVSVFKAGVGPQSLGVAYQPVNRQPVDFSVLDKRTVDEQENVDVNASIHGNWTVNEAKNRLNQFMQTNKITGEYRYFFIGPDNAKTFIAELTIFIPQLGRKLTGRESGSSKMAASKSCALSLIRQLFHLGVVEPCSSVTGTAPKRQEQMPPYPVAFSPDLLESIRICLDTFGVDWESKLESDSDGSMVLLAGRQAEQTVDDKLPGRVITWSPPVSNWDPWRGANIDDTNPNLASASMEYISEELKKGMSVPSAERDRILRERKYLPIFPCKKQILQHVSTHPVIIIKGSTGCGKTTQVCQYILDSWMEEGRGAECNLVVTQPRRISAISVAERVARERYEDMGVSVGYSVRFETVLPRPYGSMLFCTVGVLLRKLELGLRGISHVIVDEIHERDVNTDFLLVVLRDTLHMYPELRVILMSATVDTDLFSNYFNNCPVIEVPGRCFDVKTFFLEDTIEMLNFTPPPVTKKKSKSDPIDDSDDDDLPDEYQQSTKNSLAQLDDKEIPFELINAILLWCRRQGTGAVLVFLPGWSTIFSLMKHLLSSPEFRKPSYVILPLHSQLPREEQRLVFEEPLANVMKIILATNIAESSITINDVVYVIDCCKVKVKMFTSHNNMIHYATVWASRSNLEQRSGRAGRTANGYCFRLCTRSRYTKLEEHIVAEMLRSSLEELALNIKLLGLGSVSHFLSKALEPPPLDAVIEAQVLLKEMHCLDEKYEMTPLGRLIAKLPLEPRLARMLVVGCILELGDAAVTIASNISLASEVFEIEIAMNGRQRWFAGSRCSDQLAMLNAFQRFNSMQSQGLEAQQEFTCYNGLSLPALVITGEAKAQIIDILTACSFPAECLQPMRYNFSGDDPSLDQMAALLTIGSYPNVCFHKEKRKVLTTESKPALIIKTSVNCSKFQTNFPSPFFVFNEKLRTKTVYCKTLGMVTPVHLLLFGCNKVEVIKNIVRLDGWVHLDCEPRAAAMVLSLRPLLESIVTKIAAAPGYIFQMTEEDQEVISLIKQLSNFNSGRFNLPPYSMTKEGRTSKRMSSMVPPLPSEALNINYAIEQHATTSFQQLTISDKSNYGYGAEGPNKQIMKPGNDTAEKDNLTDDDSYIEDDGIVLHPPIPQSTTNQGSYNRKNIQFGECGPAEVVSKLDPNTSRAVLARHQQRAVSTFMSSSDSAAMKSNASDGQQTAVEKTAPNTSYGDNIPPQNPAIGRGRNIQRRNPTNQYYSNGAQGIPFYDPYSYNTDYQNNDPYSINPYQDPYHPAFAGPNVIRGSFKNNQRVQSMYGTANYYKQRYTQPSKAYPESEQSETLSQEDRVPEFANQRGFPPRRMYRRRGGYVARY